MKDYFELQKHFLGNKGFRILQKQKIQKLWMAQKNIVIVWIYLIIKKCIGTIT